MECLDDDDEDISEKMIVSFNQIRRKKGIYSKEKNKLLLKQCVEQNSEGLWTIKKSTMDELEINNMKFEQIFDGPMPEFEKSKKEKKNTVVNGKKVKQETLAKYLTKNNTIEKSGSKPDGKGNNNLLEKMRKREEEFKKKQEEEKQKKLEEKLAKQQKRKEENIQISVMLKDFYKLKEDQELEDQMVNLA